MQIDHTTPMRIGASAVTSILRTAWEDAMQHAKRGDAFETERAKLERVATRAVLEARDECVPGLPATAAVRIAKREATLRGYNDTGITYHDAPDEVVGRYIPERDDSDRDGWVAPAWAGVRSAGEITWRCSVADIDVTDWTDEQWRDFVTPVVTIKTFGDLMQTDAPAAPPAEAAAAFVEATQKIVDHLIASGVESVTVVPLVTTSHGADEDEGKS